MASIKLDTNNFKKQVLEEKNTILVDFWAPWCNPCKILGPVIEEVAEEVKSKAAVGKVNVDENQELAAKYGVMSIPTVILFKNGQPEKQWVGVQDKNVYVKAINA